MDVTLTPEFERLIQDDLRREVQKGLDQLDRGESVPLDAECIKSEGRRRLAQG
jgi:antitoxin ParD1/3/4